MGWLRDESGYVLVMGRPRLMVAGGTAVAKEEPARPVDVAPKPVVLAACSVPHYCFFLLVVRRAASAADRSARIAVRQSGCAEDRGAVDRVGLHEVQTHFATTRCFATAADSTLGTV